MNKREEERLQEGFRTYLEPLLIVGIAVLFPIQVGHRHSA